MLEFGNTLSDGLGCTLRVLEADGVLFSRFRVTYRSLLLGIQARAVLYISFIEFPTQTCAASLMRNPTWGSGS